MKKAIIISIIFIILANIALLTTTVQAVEGDKIQIYTKGNFERIIKYDGVLLKTAHAVYNNNGTEYPVYCLNVDLHGVGDQIASYETINNGKITDIGLWRVIINGYPYKSLEQLGVASVGEAFTATKQAIYCYVAGRDPAKYEGINEAGERTKNAINLIVTNAKNSTATSENTGIEVITNDEWEENEKNIFKEYEIKSDINISKYIIELENMPEETELTDLEGNVVQEFNSNQKFRITIPKSSLEKSGEFKIKIKTQMETKPVFYGMAPSSDLQNYALTAFSYEDVNTELVQKYEKVEPEIPETPEEPEEPEKPEQPKVPDIPKEEIPRLPVTGM